MAYQMYQIAEYHLMSVTGTGNSYLKVSNKACYFNILNT